MILRWFWYVTTAKLQLFFKTNKENCNIFQKSPPPMTDDSDDKGVINLGEM